jgi:hypothetical protein
MDRKSASELQEHMLGTYGALRVMLTVIGIALPVAVVVSGWFQRGEYWIAPSISHYYHLPATIPFFTARDFLVGGLLAAAVCLYSYKGFSTRENVALNLAGVFAFFVAVLPISREGERPSLRAVLHGTAAVLFFLSIAYVSIRRSSDTLRLLPPAKRDRYARSYFVTGLAMIASPLAAAALSFLVDGDSSTTRVIFFVETFGVWAFAAYWWIKTLEMRETEAEQRGLDGVLERDAEAPVPAGGAEGGGANAMDRVIRRVMVPNEPAVEQIVPAKAPAPPRQPKS